MATTPSWPPGKAPGRSCTPNRATWPPACTAASPESDFRFVNLGRYTSPQAFQAAIGQPGFRQAAAAVQHRAHPGLYQVVRR
jgi:hypothetical protein